jgi:mannose-6-phosphate isomerase
LIYKLKLNRVWRSYLGGANADKLYGGSEGSISCFPEEWVASAITAYNPGRNVENEGLSVTENKELLKNIINNNPEAILGKEQYKKYGNNISILLKLLDSAERLVIQAHPTVSFALEHFGSNFGKTECWYFLNDGGCFSKAHRITARG